MLLYIDLRDIAFESLSRSSLWLLLTRLGNVTQDNTRVPAYPEVCQFISRLSVVTQFGYRQISIEFSQCQVLARRPAYLAADCQLVSDEGCRQLRAVTSRTCAVRRTAGGKRHREFRRTVSAIRR